MTAPVSTCNTSYFLVKRFKQLRSGLNYGLYYQHTFQNLLLFACTRAQTQRALIVYKDKRPCLDHQTVQIAQRQCQMYLHTERHIRLGTHPILASACLYHLPVPRIPRVDVDGWAPGGAKAGEMGHCCRVWGGQCCHKESGLQLHRVLLGCVVYIHIFMNMCIPCVSTCVCYAVYGAHKPAC